MNLREAKQEVLALVEAGNAPLLVSSSGVGKSQMSRQIFEQLRDRDAKKGIRWGHSQIFLATQTPPDLIGYQFKGEKEITLQDGTKKIIPVTDPTLPLWMQSDEGLPAYAYDKFFLMIDEYGQGEADVKKAAAEIFLNGGTAPWYLPQGSVRIAATNEGTRYGVSKDFDFCIARRTRLDIKGDARVWDEDFAAKPYFFQGRTWQTMNVTRAWAMANPTLLFEGEPEKQGPWCNPRALCAADRYMQVKLEQVGNKIDVLLDKDHISYVTETMAGTIGMPSTASYMGMLQFKLSLPSYDDVVADPKGCPVPTKADQQMLMAYELAGLTQETDLAACITYIQRLPKDMSVTYITSLLRKDYKRLSTHPAMQGWISKNAALVAMIAALSS